MSEDASQSSEGAVQTAPLPEYPLGERGMLVQRANREFNARVDEHGRGKNWLGDEPRAHLLKAADELFLARGREENGDLDGMEEHSAHALNHLVMALEIAQREDGSNA